MPRNNYKMTEEDYDFEDKIIGIIILSSAGLFCVALATLMLIGWLS